jgi:tRNA threonylcarbamoyladenosine biosynthesis protein TsaE
MDAVYQLAQINEVVKAFYKANKQYKVWAFYAPMGSGKTTFIHSLCNILEVADAVSSPTFAIMNEYESASHGKIIHMDWYRLKNEQEAIDAGVEDAILSNEFCLIEWPENAPDLLPENTLKIYLETLNEDTRRIYTHKTNL